MILEGEASNILHEWVKGRYQIYYKYDGQGVFMVEIFEPETNRTFLPNDETMYFLEIIFSN
jgi:hypothetical protein